MPLRAILVAGLALCALAVVGCGDDDDCCTVPVSADRSAEPAYAGVGPYAVGFTTLELADRKVAVFYPAATGSEQGNLPAQYRQSDPFDPVLASIVENLARRQGVDISFTMPAFADLPASDAGPFPILLFSHGFGGWRLVNASLMAGIASWGFVVAAPDHIERGLNAVVTNMVRADPATDRRVLLEVLDLLQAANVTPGGFLEGRVDAALVAAAGHSAGGAAALSLIDEPMIDAIVGIASVGAVSNPPAKPTLLVVAAGDLIVTPTFTHSIYHELQSPKRFVVIEESGHNSFTDACDAIRGGASLTQLARDAGFPIDPVLLELGENGCSDADADPREIWAITQHLTVAHLRDAFALDVPPVGLGEGVAGAFPIDLAIVSE